MGINFNKTVLMTFALGSGLAALSGISTGLYYQEINFSMGLMLGVIGFSAAVVGGLGSIYGAIVGGLLFAFLQRRDGSVETHSCCSPLPRNLQMHSGIGYKLHRPRVDRGEPGFDLPVFPVASRTRSRVFSCRPHACRLRQ